MTITKTNNYLRFRETAESSSPGEFHPQALTGRVEDWRGTQKPVSSPRHVKRSMQISRTTLSLLTSSEGL
jgi:hypothetical protein